MRVADRDVRFRRAPAPLIVPQQLVGPRLATVESVAFLPHADRSSVLIGALRAEMALTEPEPRRAVPDHEPIDVQLAIFQAAGITTFVLIDAPSRTGDGGLPIAEGIARMQSTEEKQDGALEGPRPIRHVRPNGRPPDLRGAAKRSC
jgi:hypothetical protein